MSKLSVHLTFPGNVTGYGNLLRMPAEAGNPVWGVYQLNSNTYSDRDKYSPTTKLFYRRQSSVWQRIPENMFEGDPVANCDDWMLIRKENNKNLLDYWRLNPSEYKDPLNEPVLGTGPASKAIWLNRWMLRALEIANENGFKLAMYSFAVGDPDYPMWEYLKDSLRLGKQDGHILSLHAYGVYNYLIERNQDGSLSENTLNLGLRHRKIYDLLPEDCKMDIALTECGAGNGFNTGTSAQEFLKDAIEFDKEIMKDKHVKVANIFQLGGNESNCIEILLQLSEYIANTPNIEPEEPPIATLPYVVVGHLAPQNATLEIMKYIQEQAFATKSTVAQSADDIRHLVRSGLPGSKAIIYNPESWPGGIQGITQYFTGLNIEFKYLGNAVDFWMESPIKDIAFRVTDRFNSARPDYPDWSNKLHEGLDLDCYDDINTKNVSIHACQSGTVEKVVTLYTGTGYGKHVVIRHDWGNYTFKTWYCHLSEIFVSVGQTVKIGDKIGTGGKTGANAYHLHLNLQWIGYGLDGYYTSDVLNPLDYIYLKPTVNTVSGVGLAELRTLTPKEMEAITISKVKSVLALTLPDYQQSRNLIQQLKSLGVSVIGRLFFSADANSKTKFNPSDFIAYCKNGLDGFYAEGVRYFQVHNEPNLESEGYGWNWKNGAEFGIWLREVIRLLKIQYPEIKIIYPGLSPQPNTEQFFIDSTDAGCDIVGVHSYWHSASGGQWNMIDESGGMSWKAVKRHTNKNIIITEYSNNNPSESYENKGNQYKQYIELLKQDGKVISAYSFALSWPNQDINKEGWVYNGNLTAIPEKLGT